MINGGAINVSTEDILVPLPTVYAINAQGVTRTAEWTTSGAFEGAASGQTVVRLKPLETQKMTFSIDMSKRDFMATALWSMVFERGDFTYASPETAAHGCVVRVNEQPALITNPLGADWYR
ncbi:hypothetical protein GCM10027405_05510 [Arthrobacter alkaliphilus]